MVSSALGTETTEQERREVRQQAGANGELCWRRFVRAFGYIEAKHTEDLEDLNSVARELLFRNMTVFFCWAN